MMTIDGTALIVFLSFFVFMLLMKPLFWEPMLALKQQRETHVQAGEVAAVQARQKAEQLETDVAKKMGEARQKAQDIIQKKRDEARARANQHLAQSRQSVVDQQRERSAQLEARQQAVSDELAGQRDEFVRLMADRVLAAFNMQPVSSSKPG
ncbi:MAG: ATP synthase F0 subunit B [Cyanobacteria bacterium HKST-UBA06]|nr:ATP synthase F0 subunit B [Cyanobacteria bacterium HKST-UBA05]MCA9806485.1 ATP synthase F0 subunit B [Cyanobacteria bacterium HKST-UBA06]